MIQASDGGSEYLYTYGTTDQHGALMITSRTVTGTGTAAVISDPTTGQALDLQTTDGTTSLWITDGTGSPAAAIADTGNTAYTVTHDPYGTETVTSGGNSAQWIQNPYGFKNGIHSTSDNGLTKFGYRWQTSGTGGWIERDTFDAPLSPTNANRYACAGNDPVGNSDPTGRIYFTGEQSRDLAKQTVSAALTVVYGWPIDAAVDGACAATALIGCIGATAAGAALDNSISNGTTDILVGDKSTWRPY